MKNDPRRKWFMAIPMICFCLFMAVGCGHGEDDDDAGDSASDDDQSGDDDASPNGDDDTSGGADDDDTSPNGDDDDNDDNDDDDDDTAGDFLFELIDGGLFDRESASLVVGADGKYRVVIVKSRELYLYTLGDGQPESEKLAVFARYPKMVADAAGGLHVAYFDERQKSIVYLTDVSGEWRREIAAAAIEADDEAFSLDLALDAADNPHLAYTNGSLHYLRKNNDQWSDVSLDVDVARQVALALDGQNLPHLLIAGGRGDNVVVEYLTTTGKEWQRREVESHEALVTSGEYFITYEYLAPSLAIDSQGQPHVAYLLVEGAFQGLWYIYTSYAYYSVLVDSTWQRTQMTFGWDQVYEQTAMALDNNEAPHVIFSTAARLRDGCSEAKRDVTADNKLYYWTPTGGEEPVTGDTPAAIDLAMGADGVLSVCYVRNLGTSEGLHLAVKNGGPWREELLEKSSSAGAQVALDQDADGCLHVAYDDLERGKIRHGVSCGEGWTKQDVASFSDADAEIGVAADADGNVHLVAGGWGLTYFTNRDGQWLSDKIVAEDEMCRGAAIDVDAAGQPCIAYLKAVDKAQYQLFYAHQAAGGQWVNSLLDDAKNFPATIIADDRGAVHIAYSNYKAIYLTNASGDWDSDIPDTADSGDEYPTLALSDSGEPCLAYAGKYGWFAKVACRQDGEWSIRIIENAGYQDRIARSSMAFDRDGKLNLSYVYTYQTSSLKFATNRSGMWKHYSLDAGDAGQYNRLVVDADNDVHIVYSDENSLWHLSFSGIKSE